MNNLTTPSPDDDDLKPCEKCGSKPLYNSHYNRTVCSNACCDNAVPSITWQMWNTRADSPTSKESLQVQGAERTPISKLIAASHDAVSYIASLGVGDFDGQRYLSVAAIEAREEYTQMTAEIERLRVEVVDLRGKNTDLSTHIANGRLWNSPDSLLLENKGLRERVAALEEKASQAVVILSEINKISWGYDGDCGSSRIVEEATDLLTQPAKEAQG